MDLWLLEYSWQTLELKQTLWEVWKFLQTDIMEHKLQDL